MSNTVKAKSAAKAEATETAYEYEYDGSKYCLPEDRDDVGIMEAYENGRLVTATKMLVGDEVYDDLRKQGKLKKMPELNELINAAFKAMGTSEGESDASQES